MRIHMVAIGSTGDVRPYALLGRELQKRGHEVTLVAFADFADMAKDAGLGFRPLSGNVREMMAHLMKPGVKGAAFLRQVEKSLGRVAPVLLDDLLDAFKDAEVMICAFLGNTYYSVAEKYHIPVIQTQYFPMDANNVTPISSAPGIKWGRAWNRASYGIGYMLIHMVEKRYLTKWRKANRLTVPKMHPGPDYDFDNRTIPVLYAMSSLVMPRPAAWGPNIHMTGFWWDNTPVDWTPPAALTAFMEAGEPPIYVGFGSMVSGDMDKTFTIVMRALKASGIRAIVAKGWGGGELHAPDNVFVAEGFIPHDWIFPRVKAVVHHGGAGTTAAGLRAGKPTLIIPFGGDQPFWGSRVRALGCGPAPLTRERMTVERLTLRLADLVNHPNYAVAAAELGAGLRREQGTVIAADKIEELLGCNRKAQA